MRILSLAILVVNLARFVHADIPPNPNGYYVTSDDGNVQGPILLKGSVEYSWEEDEDGFTVIPNGKRNYYYARQNIFTGDIVATNLPIRKKQNGTLVGSSPVNYGLSRHEKPSDEARKRKCGEFCDKEKGKGRELRNLVSTTGTLKNLVVLFRFSDHTNRVLPSAADIGKLMNHPGDGVSVAYDPLAPTGSVREHYLKSSYGLLTIDSVIAEWVTIDYTEAYCTGGNSGLSTVIHTCLRNALSKVDAAVNFNQFDMDGDRWIDAIAFLHSGYGAEWGGTDAYGTVYTSRIWSHKWGMSTWTSAEGVSVSNYHISPSVWGTSATNIGRIGVIAHETGHYLGITDLYDGSGGSGIGSWGLMANSWGFDGSQYYPPPMDAWCKIALGWVTPTIITPSSQPYTLSPSCQSSTIFKITTNFPAGEYLLVENRQKSCLYDSQMGGSYSGGLAIWHVDENQPSWNTEGYPGQSGWPGNGNHYRIAILQADKQYELEHGYNRGNSGDLFHPGDTLGPSTSSAGPYPNSDSYAFGKGVTSSGISIINIAASGNTISFVFNVGSSSPTLVPTRKPSSKPSVVKPPANPTKIPSAKPSLSLRPTSFTPLLFRASKPGPIRSLLGKCIDVSGSNFVSGVQLQIWDCNGSGAQQWSRPTSTDLRLQTSNNLCMDASGNVGAGGAVILTTCDANLNSQKWAYDGQNLRPKYNTGMCLNIQGGNSVNGAKLIVWPCDNGSNSAWVEYSITTTSGAAMAGDTFNHVLCPVGSKVINISGRGGWYVDQLVMTCDDGKTVLGPVGGTGGGAITSSNCTSGYSSVNVTSGTYVGQVAATCSGSPSLSASIGAGLSSGSGSNVISIFQGNQRVIGMQVNNGQYVDSVAILYSSVSAVTSTLKPTARPTGRPTSRPTIKSTTKPTVYRTKIPSGKPSGRPSALPSRKPTSKPTARPTGKPTSRPTNKSTIKPTAFRTKVPSEKPSRRPSILPSRKPTSKPTAYPTKIPSRNPSRRPSTLLSRKPTLKPTTRPTVKPTSRQTMESTTKPTTYPTKVPSTKPSRRPSILPSRKPTSKPTTRLTGKPTSRPTIIVTKRPTRQPSSKPSLSLRPTSFTPLLFRASKPGPIRSLLGKCIDVSGSNFVSGVQLQIWDCNGSGAQQWSRPTSTDLRLQTSNNLCMDASGNVGAGGAVILTTCDANLNSQKWAYDGQNLRPKYNTGMCLNIQGGNSVNGAKLIVWPCDNGSNSAWVEYSITTTSGAAMAGDTFNHVLCPVGSKVINISGRGGWYVDQLVMTCDDGKTVLGPVGGTGGGAITSSNCTSGYSSVNVTSGTYVGQVAATCSGSPSLSASIGAGLSSGSGSNVISIFQGNQRVIGMQVNNGQYVDSVAFLYSVSTVTVPTAFPSAKPSFKPSNGKTRQPTGKRPTRKPSPRRPTRKPSVRKPTRKPSVRKPTRKPSVRKPTRRPTKKPTIKPVRNPTSAPISSSLTSLQIVLQTDNKGYETWFYVYDVNSSFVTVLSSYSILNNNVLYPPFTAQVDKTHCYQVYIKDDGNDGMCCAYGQGYYEIWWGGALVKKSSFQSLSNVDYSTVGVC